MLAALDGVDVLVFTGGIGFGSNYIREKVVAGLGFLGIEIENIEINTDKKISIDDSAVEVWAIETKEEKQMLDNYFARSQELI